MSSSVNCFDYNCYRHSVDLFVNGTSLLSEEGTTEGGPLAMPFLYALATVPLIKELSSVNVQQVWYADDSAAVGSLEDILSVVALSMVTSQIPRRPGCLLRSPI